MDKMPDPDELVSIYRGSIYSSDIDPTSNVYGIITDIDDPTFKHVVDLGVNNRKLWQIRYKARMKKPVEEQTSGDYKWAIAQMDAGKKVTAGYMRINWHYVMKNVRGRAKYIYANGAEFLLHDFPHNTKFTLYTEPQEVKGMTLKEALAKYRKVVRLSDKWKDAWVTANCAISVEDALAEDWVEYQPCSTLKELSVSCENGKKLRCRSWGNQCISVMLWTGIKPTYTTGLGGVDITHLLESDTNTDWYVVE